MSDIETQPPDAECHPVLVVEISDSQSVSDSQEQGYTSDKDLFDTYSTSSVDLEEPVFC